MLAPALAGSTITPRNNRNTLGDGEQKTVLLIRGLSEEILCLCLLWGTALLVQADQLPDLRDQVQDVPLGGALEMLPPRCEVPTRPLLRG